MQTALYAARTTLSGQQFLSSHLIHLRISIFPSAADL
jgi:hypothetical protein